MTVVTLHYTEELARRAVRVFWWKTLGWPYVAANLLLLVSLSLSLLTRDRSWMVGTAGTLAVSVIFGLALYWVHRRAGLARLRRMRTPQATMECDDERFRLSSDVGTLELEWRSIREVWCSSEFVLVFLGKAQFFTLPMTDLREEGREMVVARAKAGGARVRCS